MIFSQPPHFPFSTFRFQLSTFNFQLSTFHSHLALFSSLRHNEIMFEVRVEADFAAAHFLRDYHGKCENLHGHNYKVFAHVKGNKLDGGGMLLDFSVLKGTLRDVCKTLDHTNLNDMPVFDQNPSAERIAMYIFNQITERVPELRFTGDSDSAHLFAVDVFETETSRARYCIE